jgi:protein-tyrosine phosphatase
MASSLSSPSSPSPAASASPSLLTHDFHVSLLPQLRREQGFLEAQEILPFTGLFIGGAVCARTPSLLAYLSGVLAANGDLPPPQLLAQHPLCAVRRTLSLPLDDHTEQDLSPYLRGAVEFIQAERLAGEYGDAAVPGYAGEAAAAEAAEEGKGRPAGSGVLVHCTLGISRSAAVCCAYIMWAGRERLDTALKLVRRARRWARPNDGFLEQLAHFEALLGLAGPARAWTGAAEGGGTVKGLPPTLGARHRRATTAPATTPWQRPRPRPRAARCVSIRHPSARAGRRRSRACGTPRTRAGSSRVSRG